MRRGLFILLLVLAAGYARGQVPLEQVTLVPDASVAANPVNATQPFTITTAGSYTVTLTDLQEPTALSALSVAIVSATATAKTLTLPASTATVTLQPGNYFAQVIATAASGSLGGTFSVVVAPAAGGTDVLAYQGVVAGSSTPLTGTAVLQAQFSVSTAGSYTLSAPDLQFPVPLQSAPTVLALTNCGSPPVQGCTSNAYFAVPGPAFLPAGNYDLFAFAQASRVSAGGPYAGLYSISITGNGTPATAYSATVPVGQLPAATTFSIPSAGTVSLALADISSGLSLPLVKPLASLEAIVTQGSSTPLLATVSGPSGSMPYTFTASAAGTAQLYVDATANAAGQSGWAAYLSEPVNGVTTTLADVAQPVLLDSAHYGYGFQTPSLPAGTYTMAVHDFATPGALTAQDSLVVQKAAVLSSIAAGNPASVSLNFGPTATGVVNLLVFPTVQSAGLFGVAVEPSSGPNAFQATQAVGTLFSPVTLNVPAAGNYGVTFTDLGFPAAFTSLQLVATLGNADVGQPITSSGVGVTGTLSFDALAAGTYTLNVLAQVGSMHYGLYGLTAGLVPTATLTPAASSVTSGQSVLLSWTSMNASGCTASGGWTGAEPTSGSMVNVGTITQNTSYTLTCTGDGGSSTPQTATVDFSSSSSSSSSSGGGSGNGSSHSGGGAFSPGALLVLSLLTGLNLRRRRAMLHG
jgi:hypothetical protein